MWRHGRPELCDVKSEERLADPDFQAQVHAIGRACAEAGVGYRVLSEPDRQLLMNVRRAPTDRPLARDRRHPRAGAGSPGGVAHRPGIRAPHRRRGPAAIITVNSTPACPRRCFTEAINAPSR